MSGLPFAPSSNIPFQGRSIHTSPLRLSSKRGSPDDVDAGIRLVVGFALDLHTLAAHNMPLHDGHNDDTDGRMAAT